MADNSKVPSGDVYGLGQITRAESIEVNGDAGRKRNMAVDACGDQAAGAGSHKSGKA